ncbi:hypothetical protein HK105_206589 [Polyrhizophydium stewartii]|uniref:Uncharacterized protein n=1 Tax=Polyrhizophydium stewartii TaxID=2732419 RepID=A0ABR4N2W4_9FUNG|nr:Apoptosis-inducing factor 1, mitochondrial [Polyrhizophydium stewartii]
MFAAASSTALRRAAAARLSRAVVVPRSMPLRPAVLRAAPAGVRLAHSSPDVHGKHGEHGEHGEHASESSSTPARLLLVASLLALGPGFHYLFGDRADSPAPAPVADKPKPKIPSRPTARAERPKPIKGVPFVPYVLIGGGTASYSAMEAIREAQPDAQILIISEEEFVPYQRPPLSKELWFGEASNKDLIFKDWQGNERGLFYLPKEAFNIMTPDQIKLLGTNPTKVQYLANAKVVKLNPEDQTVTLANGSRIQYARVLIATGGTPKTLPAFETLSPEAKSRVMTYRGIEDFKRLEQIAHGKKTIAVLGGGFLGSELAVALAGESGTRIVQAFPEDGNMGLVFPRYLTKWTTALLGRLGIDVKTQADLSAVVEKDDYLELQFNNGVTVEADYVVQAVGLMPNQKFAEASGLEIDAARNGIVVNAELEARTNVFAAGDVTSFHDVTLGRRRVEHYDHAVMSGRLAGFNMTGAKKPYTHQSMFWSDLGPKVGYEATGIVDAKLPTMGVWAKGPHDNLFDDIGFEEFGKGVVFYLSPEKKVLGVLTWNVFGKMDLARKIIREGKVHTDVDALAKLFGINSA